VATHSPFGPPGRHGLAKWCVPDGLPAPCVRGRRLKESESYTPASNIEILDLKRVLLDELPPWFNVITHESGEQVVGGSDIIEPNLE
jgi:hypothetical protein